MCTCALASSINSTQNKIHIILRAIFVLKFKVILYSYLILKKMTERITDS